MKVISNTRRLSRAFKSPICIKSADQFLSPDARVSKLLSLLSNYGTSVPAIPKRPCSLQQLNHEEALPKGHRSPPHPLNHSAHPPDPFPADTKFIAAGRRM
ncbi:hypothetical protein ACFX15_042450 [Malus domestica]